MLGTIQKGKVIDKNDEAYCVQVNGVTYELNKLEVTQEQVPQLGDIVQGFIYDNKNHKKQMTRFYPLAMPDQYGWSKVTEVRRDLGVSVDIGLPDRDVAISLDDLPLDKAKWPRIGDRLLVTLETDHKDRTWAKMADENVFEQLPSEFPQNMKNKNLLVTVYATHPVGDFVLANDFYLGFIHESEMMTPLRLGERIKARVIGISKYDRLNLSVLPRAFEEADKDSQMILMSPRRETSKSLSFYDKSDAQDMKNHFGISKSAFKRAIGRLLKQGLIVEDKDAGKITLVDKNEEE